MANKYYEGYWEAVQIVSAGFSSLYDRLYNFVIILSLQLCGRRRSIKYGNKSYSELLSSAEHA